MEAILSLIDPSLWFQGSDVRDALGQIIQIANDSIKATAETAANEAVKEAVSPLLADIAAKNEQIKGYNKLLMDMDKDRLAAVQRAQAAEGWAIAGWCVAGGALVVEIIGIVVYTIIK
ncbi:MAG: hypothetical protein M0P71_18235 [Melioribacteraceae bacterium]|jgi:hypothetical protein|nr:hypothetical protein [Melioribacteraceae bacterium]